MIDRTLGLVFGISVLLFPFERAAATSRDFIDETSVSQGFEAREVGLELGMESRLDRDYRLQGWYTAELEFAPGTRWLLEGAASAVDAGSSFAFGGWRGGGRCRLIQQPAWPLDVSAIVEYELETATPKHIRDERALIPRVALTRTSAGTLVTTVNLGVARQVAPFYHTRLVYGLGVRWPEGEPLMAGIELTREPLERATHIVPQFWIALPGRARLRLGGIFGTQARPYWFEGRAIVETEF
jgi:hypothetical protein